MCKHIDTIICAPFFFFFFFCRYQYYLQVKKDVLDGRLISSFEQGIRLAGLAVQGRMMWPHSLCPGMALVVWSFILTGHWGPAWLLLTAAGFPIVSKVHGWTAVDETLTASGWEWGTTSQCSTFLFLKFMQADLNKTPVLPALTTKYFAVMNLLHVLWFQMQITSKSTAAALILPLIKISFCWIVLYEVWKNTWP